MRLLRCLSRRGSITFTSCLVSAFLDFLDLILFFAVLFLFQLELLISRLEFYLVSDVCMYRLLSLFLFYSLPEWFNSDIIFVVDIIGVVPVQVTIQYLVLLCYFILMFYKGWSGTLEVKWYYISSAFPKSMESCINIHLDNMQSRHKISVQVCWQV